MDCLNLVAGQCQQQYFSPTLGSAEMGLVVAVGTGSSWGESGEVVPGPSPAAWLSCMEVLPCCFRGSVVALLLVFVQLSLSYPNLLLEKPLCYLKHVLLHAF